jgi:hypothetical protein
MTSAAEGQFTEEQPLPAKKRGASDKLESLGIKPIKGGDVDIKAGLRKSRMGGSHFSPPAWMMDDSGKQKEIKSST